MGTPLISLLSDPYSHVLVIVQKYSLPTLNKSMDGVGPLDFGLGHGTCCGQWDINPYEVTRHVNCTLCTMSKSIGEIGHVLLCSGHCPG